jgi:flagellar biosynthesis protein FlhA
MNKKLSQIGLLYQPDIFFALLFLAMLGVFLIPLKTWMLDGLLVLSFGLSLTILMVVMVIQKTEELAAFPTWLLVSTLFRLALNVASTRIILSYGHLGPHAAGQMIHGFGHMLMQGQFATGVVIFFILMIVNFFVVTKGATRIAEVAARFSLDALPGKQLSIDAELSSGMINQEEAKKRRQNLEEQTSFFGSMDGASKFVRGDALAAILILILNILGGFFVGVMYYNMSALEAFKTYGFLAIGDSLVAQIPSLVVSIASGLLISRSSKKGSAHDAFMEQFLVYPKVLLVVGGLFLFFGLVPGFPFFSSIIFGFIFIGIGRYLYKYQKLQKVEIEKSLVLNQYLKNSDHKKLYSNTKALILEYASDLKDLPSFYDDDHKLISHHLLNLGKNILEIYGVEIPSIHLELNKRLPSEHIALCIHGFEWGRHEFPMHKWHAVRFQSQIMQENCWEQKWISEAEKDIYHQNKWTLMHPFIWLSQLWSDLIADHLSELVSVSFFKQRLEALETEDQKLYQDMVPSQISSHHVIQTLKRLLSERIPLKNMNKFLEGLHANLFTTQDPDDLAERIRPYLLPELWKRLQTSQGKIPIMFLNGQAEKICQEYISPTDKKQMQLPPSYLELLFRQIREKISENTLTAIPVLVCSPVLRIPMREILKIHLPQLSLLSSLELPPHHAIHMLSAISFQISSSGDHEIKQ